MSTGGGGADVVLDLQEAMATAATASTRRESFIGYLDELIEYLCQWVFGCDRTPGFIVWSKSFASGKKEKMLQTATDKPQMRFTLSSGYSFTHTGQPTSAISYSSTTSALRRRMQP